VRDGLRRALEERRRLREGVLAQARQFAEAVRRRLGRATVVLYGSYARGDFNLWSDVDVIVVSDAFSGVPPLRRYDLVMEAAPPGFEVKLWTPEEARGAMAKPWWREALKRKVVLADDYGLFAREPP